MGTQWFYWTCGQKIGPVEEAVLKASAEVGTLRPEDLVWTEPMKDWLPAGQATEWKFGPAAAPLTAVSAESTSHTLSYAARSDEQLVLSPRVIDLMRNTGPWVRFLAILAYIFAGLLALGGIFMLVQSATARFRPVPPAAGVLYLVLAVVYLFPAGYLSRYASALRRLQQMRRNVDLEEAIDAQRAFWKLCGILTIIVFGLYLVGVAVAIVVRIFG
jgi:hypothetical protein